MFFGRVLEEVRRGDTLLCIGLDPDPTLIPVSGMGVAAFNRAIIEATHDLVCAYKLNLAFYEALGKEKEQVLEATLASVKGYGIPVIGDAKVGDIENTSRFSAKALIDWWGFEAVTVNPYMGTDAVAPFLEYAERGVFVLCRTSNPGAADFQSLLCWAGPLNQASPSVPPQPLYELVALRAGEWNTRGNVGLVMGATDVEALRRVRALCPDLPMLIPGVGPQGGDLEATIEAGVNSQGEGVLMNVSRQVLYASQGGDFAERAREAAETLRERVNKARRSRVG